MKLKLTPTLVAAALAGTAGLAQAQISDGVVKIGVLNDMSGPFSEHAGMTSVAAVRQAIEDFGPAARGLNVEVVFADHQNRPDTGLGIARRWFDVDGVDVIIDVPGSAVALAVSGLAREKDRLFIGSGAGTADLTGVQCSPNTIHWSYDTWMLAKTTGEAMVRSGGETWYFITADYAFGHALERDTSAMVQAAGGRVLGSTRHPFPGTTDFASFLVRAQSSRAQVIAIANAGNDTINTVKQAAEFGLTRRGARVVGMVMTITDVHALGLRAAQNLFFSESFYWDLNDRTRALSARLQPKIGDKRLNMLQAGCYGGVTHWLKAVADLGPSARGSGRAVAERMKAMPTDDDAFGPGRIRPDGRKLHPAHLLQVKAPEESRGPWDYARVVASLPGEDAFRPMNAGGCALVTG
jgi:branched-chain amino acid transport system substrate-binding protein